MIGIIGSRHFPHEIFNSKIGEVYNMICKLNTHENWEKIGHADLNAVVTGEASGVDTWTIEFCKDNNINYKSLDCLRPDINHYFLCRDAEIVAHCLKYLIAFHDGTSRGTDFTMRYGAMRGKSVLVVDSKGRDYWFGEVF